MNATFWAICGLALWVVPFTGVSVRHHTFSVYLPQRWRFQMTTGALFIHRNTAWSQAKTLIRVGTDPNWVEVPSPEITPLQIAGQRYRWDRAIWDKKMKKVPSFWPRSAEFVAQRWAEQHPDRPFVSEVRLVRILKRSTDSEVKHPTSRWSLPSFDAVPLSSRTEISYCKLLDGKWVNVGVWKEPLTSSPLASGQGGHNSAGPVRRKSSLGVGSSSVSPLLRAQVRPPEVKTQVVKQSPAETVPRVVLPTARPPQPQKFVRKPSVPAQGEDKTKP